MLRACARAVFEAQGISSASLQGLRHLAAPTWPAEVPTPAGAKPFDPSGPLSQVDALADGLPQDDPFVKLALDMKNLRVAVDKLKSEEATRSDGVPPGLATGKDGSVDEAYYTQTQGFHPDFVKELRSAMQEEAKTHPKPAKDDSWEKCIATVQPLVEEEQERLVKQLQAVRAKEKELAEFEERLEEITVDEMLERHPQLAQEIKDEIEAGVWHPTDAGYKIGQDATLTEEKGH